MRRLIVDTAIRVLLKLICRVRAPGIGRVPHHGPLILSANHTNFLEIPVIYTLLRPRRVIGLAKAETWNNPALRILANLWGAIPLRRGSADTTAFRKAEEVLKNGGIVALAPEGTRSGSGRLQKANAGIITLAHRTGAPILPIVHFGGERVWSSLKHGRRTVFTVRTGRPIQFADAAVRSGVPERPEPLTRAERQDRLDKLMAAMAALLPSEYRGYYSRLVVPDMAEELDCYLRFHPDQRSVVDAFREIATDPRAFERERSEGHFTGSAFVVNRERTHTLLVHHRSLGIWVQPGGHADGERDLRKVAETELVEETGVEQFRLVPDRIFDLDRHEIPANGGVPRHYHYDVRYLVIAPIEQQIRRSAESIDVRWVSFADIDSLTNEQSVLRMVAKANEARWR